MVGFRAWRDGVWVLDLDRVDLRAALSELLVARMADTVVPRQLDPKAQGRLWPTVRYQRVQSYAWMRT